MVVVPRDLISSLPSNIISNILSRLPTKYVVRTCVLSKAWENKWTTIDNIDIEVEESHSLTFVEFVDRVLFNAQNVRCFRFSSSDDSRKEHDMTHMKTWLSNVFSRNIEKVNISSYYDSNLPRSLMTCTSLKEPEIDILCTWKTPVSSYFPNLAKLTLKYVRIMNETSNTDTLTFHFPKLKSLEVKDYCWLNVKFVEIYGPALISFLSRGNHVENPSDVESYTIKIIGANLQNFETYGQPLDNFLLTGSTVSHAALKIDDYLDNIVQNGMGIRRLLNESSGLKSLAFTSYVAQVSRNYFLLYSSYVLAQQFPLTNIAKSFCIDSKQMGSHVYLHKKYANEM